jgi:hypothetical protein|tara:strand:+ start:77 stop:367 length:291 start_codon:yes stop_codon:yes gene_type:complete
MKKDDVVFQDYQGIRRFGVVTHAEMREDKWKWLKVKWFGDTTYENAMSTLFDLRGVDYYRKEYRVDELRRINPQSEIDKLRLCLSYSQREERNFGQ